MFLIIRGAIAVRRYKGEEYVELALLCANEVLGELSFFDRNPRSATAVAVTDVEVLEIQFEALDKVYATVPNYMQAIMASVAARLRTANDTIRQLQNQVRGDRQEPIPSDIPVTLATSEED